MKLGINFELDFIMSSESIEKSAYLVLALRYTYNICYVPNHLLFYFGYYASRSYDFFSVVTGDNIITNKVTSEEE